MPTIPEKIKLIDSICDQLYRRLESCDICPRECRVNRHEKPGFCGAKEDVYIYTAFLHQGEEPGISAKTGSGTLFFSGCSLKCCYCQNFKFSQKLTGHEFSIDKMAAMMLKLQKKGAANINLVTPTHYLPQILKALSIAYENGLNIPLVYNTSGYEKPQIIQMLDGIVDIYLPDAKYFDSETAAKYSSGAKDYPQNNQASLLEMYRQQPRCIPGLQLDCKSGMQRGMIVRHLVLPGHIQESLDILKWLKNNLPDALVSVMFQYQPYYKAKDTLEINRPVNKQEYQAVKDLVETIHIQGWVQEYTAQETLAGAYFEPGFDKLGT